MGVVFFPTLPFMGVMLFPSFVLGNVSGEGGTFLVPLSLFYVILSLPLPSSLSPSPSFSLPFLLLFFFEGTACTVCFQDVMDDTTDCN